MSAGRPFRAFLSVVGPETAFRQLAVLEALAAQPDGGTIRGLAAEIGVSKPVITRAMNSLEAADLAHRVSDRKDRRDKSLRLLPAGAQVVKDMAAVINSAAG